MVYIDSNNRIKMTSGDTAYLKVAVEGYLLKEGDVITLSVSNSTVSDIEMMEGAAFTKTIKRFEPDGSGTIKIDPIDTKNIFGKRFYEIQLTKENGDVHTIIPRNIFELIEEVDV